MTEAEKIAGLLHERGEIYRDVDGYFCYWQSIRGTLSSWELRIIADELDRLNKDLDEIVQKELSVEHAKLEPEICRTEVDAWPASWKGIDAARQSRVNLLRRAAISDNTIASCINSDSLIGALRVVAELNSDAPPDDTWFRDFYLITGEHMVRTEEGWIPAEFNTREHTGAEPMEVLDEVNADKVGI